MKKGSKTAAAEEEMNEFTEGIDYLKTGETSIWGPGDRDTQEVLENTRICGRWLNLAAGDGRYNSALLDKADFVVAADIEKSALEKLYRNTPSELRARLETRVLDLTETFPFEAGQFDGVLCTSTLHYFPEETLRPLFSEIDRILKSKGTFLIDFATDILRVRTDGNLYIRKSEPQYTFEQGKRILVNLLPGYEIKIRRSAVQPEEIKTQRIVYELSCNLIILVAQKQ